MDPKLVSEWKAALRKVLGDRAPPSVKMKPRWKYQSPLTPELLEAWIAKSGDPDDAQVRRVQQPGLPWPTRARRCGIANEPWGHTELHLRGGQLGGRQDRARQIPSGDNQRQEEGSSWT